MGKGPEDLVVVEGVSRLSRLSTTLRAAPDGCRGERVTWKLLVSATKGVLSRISKVPPSCPLQRSTILLTLGPFSSPRNPFTGGFLARDIVIRRCFIHRRVFWYFFFFLSSSHRGIYLVCCRIDACTIHTRHWIEEGNFLGRWRWWPLMMKREFSLKLISNYLYNDTYISSILKRIHIMHSTNKPRKHPPYLIHRKNEK